MSLCLVLPNNLLAGGDHHHETGPHGGIVHSLGSTYHIEGKRDGAQVSIYVLDSQGAKVAPITEHEGVSIQVITPGKGQEKSEIKSGDVFDQMTVAVPAKGNVTVLVNLKQAGKPLSAVFNFKEEHKH